jgi:hypothetical protein
MYKYETSVVIVLHFPGYIIIIINKRVIIKDEQCLLARCSFGVKYCRATMS